ncbi:AsmA-like C-terminal domain-containing protein [uncultured Desulfobacter sp.]|uniref:AsmA-like C-terminal domain-containing protein n=1 Tax=uncultured Desulfobacter sp. TaxID=240139 RepID=UPI002AAB5C46|nr:AsmA-like C-terminal domain-containing protein [uncultured Desulfobacter sp.]
MNKKGIQRIALFCAVIVPICTVAMLFIIPPLINTAQVKARLTKFVQDRTGIEVRFNHLSFIFNPLPGICITGIFAQIDENNQVTIPKAAVELDSIRLLEFRPAVRRITLQSPELISNSAAGNKNNPTTPFNIATFLENGLNGLPGEVPSWIRDLDIIVTHARSRYFNTMDCRVRLTNHTKSMNLQARISGLFLDTHNIPEFGPAVKGRITRIEIPYLDVNLNHDNNTILAGNLKIPSFLAHLEAPKDRCIEAGELNLNVALSKDRLNVHLTPFELLYPKGRIGIDLSLAFDQQASTIEFSGEQIDISQARQVGIPLLQGLEVSRILFDVLRSGTAQKVVVGFKDNDFHQLFKGENLFLNGCAHGATVKIPGVPIIAENVSGCAEMKNLVLSIHPKGGFVGKNTITGGNLDINFGHHHVVPFSGKFPVKVNLAGLPATLIAILPDTGLAREMSKIDNLSGRADAVLELNSSLSHKDLDVKVTAKNILARGNYQRLPLPIQINGGVFLLDKHEIVLKNISGAIGDSRISNLNADIDTMGSVPMTIKNTAAAIILEQTVPLADLFPGVKEKLGPVKNFSGTMNILDLRVDGPMFSPGLWQIHLAGRVNNGDISFTDNNTPAISGLSCELNVSPSTIKLSDIACTINDITWLEKNISSEYTQSIVLPLVLSQGQFEKQTDSCQFQGQLLTPFGTKILFMVNGPAMDQMTPFHVQVEDGERTHADVIFYKNPDMPVLDFSGKLEKTTIDNMLHTGSFLYRQLQEVTGGNALTVSTDQASNLTITSDKLNLDPVLSQLKTSAGALSLRPLVKQKQIYFNVSTLDFDQRIYQGVKAKVTITQPSTDLDIIHAGLCDLDLSGTMTINHAKDDPKVLTHVFLNTDQETDVSLSIGCLTGTQSVIEGIYTLQGELSGSAQALDQIKSKQNGSINFQAQSGRIYKATVLSRVLSVLNILEEPDLKQQGFGFKKMTANAEVKDSVVHIEKAFIDADDMAIMAEGWVDPLNDALDITFLVAPFKTIDTIIKNIPIVNTIMNGRLASFPARAYGKLSDPTVMPLHPAAVQKGLLNLLEDLVKTPVRLLEGVNENEK